MTQPNQLQFNEFIYAMSNVLNAKSHKSGWEDISPIEYIQRLRLKITELENHLVPENEIDISEEEYREVAVCISCDIANYAMFVGLQSRHQLDGWSYLNQR